VLGKGVARHRVGWVKMSQEGENVRTARGEGLSTRIHQVSTYSREDGVSENRGANDEMGQVKTLEGRGESWKSGGIR